MTESLTISKLNNEIKILNYELSKSRQKATELENSLIKLQKDYTDLKVRFYISSSKEIEYQNMKENLKEKNDIISNLEKEMAKIKRNFEQEKKLFDAKYRHDVEEVNYINEKLTIRNESASKFEKLNDILYDRVQQLEKLILSFKAEEKKKFDEQELNFEKKLTKTKKKMLDFINKANELKNKKSKSKLEIVEKFSILNHNSLLNELEFESLQLEDLLKQREHLDKVITQMKSDISIHKNVEKVLVNKNKKYIDMIRMLSEKIEKNKKEKEGEKTMIKKIKLNETNNEILKKKDKQFLFNKIRKNIDINKRYFDKKIELNKSQSLLKTGKFNDKRMNLTSYKTQFLQRNNSVENIDYKEKNEKIIYEKILLQKDLIKKTKEIDILRNNCNHYKDKLNFINNRYSNILSLYDTVLEKIHKEYPEDLKEIFIDINEFNKCEFNKLSPDKKYSLVILLIQCILPLINENNLPENIKKNMKNTQTKFYLNNETCDSSFRVKNINSSLFDINMRENENKLREIRDGTWHKFKNKNKKRNSIKKEDTDK